MNNFKRAFARALLYGHGDASAIVSHGHAIIGMDGDVNGGAVASKGFVHAVVHHFVH
jgi:hypothetical protein